MTKQARHRRRCQAEGRCPHCGKPCEPYAECYQRRLYKRLNAGLRRWARWGFLRREDGYYVIKDENAGGPRGVFYQTESSGQAPRDPGGCSPT